MYGGEKRCIQGFGGETRGEKDHLEDPGVGGTIILRWIFRKWDGGSWIGLIWLSCYSNTSDRSIRMYQMLGTTYKRLLLMME